MESVLDLDRSLFVWINDLPHPSWLVFVMTTVSTITIGSTLWLLLALAAALLGNPSGGFRAALAVLCTAVVVGGVLKPGVARERPSLALDGVAVYTVDPSDSRSFPSGHAAGAAAGAYGLSRAWPSASPLLWVTAAIVAVSRPYLGVHYPLDIVGGLLVGLVCAYVVTGGRTSERTLRTNGTAVS